MTTEQLRAWTAELGIEQYHAHEHDSSSTLRVFERSPAEYYERRITRRITGGTTDPQRLGDLAHLVILQPELAETKVIVPPPEVCASNGAWSGNAFKEFKAANPGKLLVKQAELDNAKWQAESCWKNPAVRQFLERTTIREQSIFFIDGEHALKVRIDAGVELDAEIGDLKKTTDIDDFPKAIARYGYAKQAELYCRGYEAFYGVRPTFYFLLVSDQPPFDCCLRRLPQEALDLGRQQNDETLAKLLACKRGQAAWIREGFDEVTDLVLPPWLTASTYESI